MIKACREYLRKSLQLAGINRIHDRAEDVPKHQAISYAAVSIDAEDLRFDGSLVARANDCPNPGERTFRRRLYRRSIQFVVKIVCRDQGQAETAGAAFLAGLERRILDDQGNAILITARSGEPDEDTSLLKAQGVVAIVATFEGGVYVDKTVKLYDHDTWVFEGEIEGVQ